MQLYKLPKKRKFAEIQPKLLTYPVKCCIITVVCCVNQVDLSAWIFLKKEEKYAYI